MKEQNQLNPANQSRPVKNSTKKKERLITLDQVLLEEYKTLEILNASDVAEINAFRIKIDEERGIIPYLETKKLPPKEREEQFNLRRQRRIEVLKKIREKLNGVALRKYNETRESYKDKFRVTEKNKHYIDEEARLLAIELAAMRELNGSLALKRKEFEQLRETGEDFDIETKIQFEIYHEALKSTEIEKENIKEKLKSVLQNEKSNSLTAICFSGGGIRSATFNLGILQSLAKHGLLDKFHYLSTVSGGGYIGSWLSAWIYQTRVETEKKLKDKHPELTISPPSERFDVNCISEIQDKLNIHTPDLPEPVEVTHLRTYSNFLSPRTGLFSTDTWTLIAVYLRNLLLNWTVLIPLIAAVLLFPKLLVSAFDLLDENNFPEIVFAVSILAGLIGFCCINMLRPSLQNYSYFRQIYTTDEIGKVKSSDTVFWWCELPILILAFGVTAFWFWRGATENEANLLNFIYFGIALFLGGYLLSWSIMLKNYIQFWKEEKKKRKSGQNIKPESNCYKENNNFPWSFWNWIKKKYKTYLSEPIYSIICGGIGGALLYLAVEKIIPKDFGGLANITETEFYVCFGAPLFLIIIMLSAALFTGIAVRITDDDDREWMARFGALLLKAVIGWVIFFGAVIFGPKLIINNIFGNWDSFIKSAAGIFATISGLLSVLAGFSSKTPASEDEPAKSWTGYLIPLLSSVVAPIFVLLLIALISLGTQTLTDNVKIASPGSNQLTWFFIFLAIGVVMGFFINVNKFSFHATYRERLIRAYLGASNKNRITTTNSFTDLNSKEDNIEMKNLLHKPFHILNMTLNMVKSDNLAWQNRKAQSFTASPLHCGSSNMGNGSGNYRRSDCYGFNKQNDRAITLGTSLAISGAAASPNMGYFTQSAAVSFLMVLLNVRLGWWLGNPGRCGNKTWKKSAPKWSGTTFYVEAMGKTSDDSGFVYLADGGQFENLGLYEMVLRRCKTIVVCDGGSDVDFKFFDLGSAVHKINVDMGIPIKFDSNPAKGRNCSIAKIKYSAVDGEDVEDGTLIYIKPTLDENQPIDIVQYQSVNPDFPHEGTLDQFYSETQFESYRKLGFNMMESICKGQKITSAADLKAAAEEYLKNLNDKPRDAY